MKQSLHNIRCRSEITRNIRSFFEKQGFLEVDTPLLSSHLIPECSMENFKTTLKNPYGQDKNLYLIPSPELFMKELLAAGAGDIFQICKCFRNCEQISPIHNPEFTMLEWYKCGITADENIRICENLISGLCQRETPRECRPPFRIMAMEEAFQEIAGFSLEKNMERSLLTQRLKDKDIPFGDEDSWEVLFHRLFLSEVEPRLPMDRPLILKNYPSRIPTLAKNKPDSPWAERWELYMKGMEIGNCYSEEANIKKIQSFYRKEGRKKQENALVKVSILENWPQKLKGFPPSSGAALGIDRLIAALLGQENIQGVILFPIDAILREKSYEPPAG